MKTKNIIFDLGGVILNLDIQLSIDAFNRLGATNLTMDFVRSPEGMILHEYEIGKISSAEFRKGLCGYLSLNLTDVEFDQAWNAMLLDIPQERLDFIAAIKNRYRTFLFSNTNEIHLAKVMAIYQQQNQQASLQNYFEKEYYSHLLGMRKPDKQSFLQILTENNLQAEETLFIDDHSPNIVGAQAVGLQTFHLAKPRTFLALAEIL